MANLKKNFLFSFFEKISRAGLSLFSLVIVGRYLGPESYGYLNYLLAIITYFQLLGVFGLDQILIGMLVRDKENEVLIFWQSLIFKTTMSCLSFCFYLVFLFYRNEISWESILFGFAITGSIFDNSRIYLESQNKHATVSKVEIFYQMITAALKITLCILKFPVSFIFSLFVLDFLVPKIILLLILKDTQLKMSKTAFSMNLSDFKKFFKAGIYHCFSTVFVILYMKIDQVMVGSMLGMIPLGNYAAAVRLSDAWYFLPVMVASVLYPSCLREGRELDNRNLQSIFDLTLWVSIVIVGLALLFNDHLYMLLFGDRFEVDKHVLNLLFISGVFISITISTNAWLNLKGAKEVLFIRTLVGAATNISLNFYLIPLYGLIGCTWATLIAYAVTCLLTFVAKDSRECGKYFMKSLNVFEVYRRLLELRSGDQYGK